MSNRHRDWERAGFGHPASPRFVAFRSKMIAVQN